MSRPTAIVIHTGALRRLVKEESTYHKELAEGEEDIRKLEEKYSAEGPDQDGNTEFMIRQLKKNVEQTRSVFGPIRGKIEAAKLKLEELVQNAEKTGDASAEELENARAALLTVTLPWHGK